MSRIGKYILSATLLVVAGFGTTSSAKAVSFEEVGALSLESLSDLFYNMEFYEQGDNKYVVVASEDAGLLVVDVTDPMNIELAGQYDTTGGARDVFIDGNYAYVADGNTTTGLTSKGKLYVIDLTDPTNPTSVGTYEKNFGVFTSVVVSDAKKAFVADSVSGVRVVDVADPTNPTEIGSVANTSGGTDMAEVSNRVYLLQATLSQITIIDSGNYNVIGTVASGAATTARQLSLEDSTLFVANGEDGVKLYDITNMDNPTALGVYNTSGVTMGLTSVTMAGSTWLALADSGSGLEIVDVSDEANITSVAGVDTDDYSATNDVVYNDGVLYVLSNGVRALNVAFNFEVEGSKSGKVGKVKVIEGGNEWCTITAYEDEVGAQAKLGDVNGDGFDDLVTVPKSKMKQPKMQLWDPITCTKYSQSKLSENDKKVAFTLAVGNYYGDSTSKAEIVVAKAVMKDGLAELAVKSYFVNSSNKMKLKATATDEPTLYSFGEEGIKVKIQEGSKYPVSIQAKETSDDRVRYKLVKKDDGSFKLKKQE